MSLAQIDIIFAGLLIIFLGIPYIYYDLKKREVGGELFYAFMAYMFVLYSISYLFQFSIMLIIPTVATILFFIVAYRTGEIGVGDAPLFGSTFLFVFLMKNLFASFSIFGISFVLALLLTPIILYRRAFSKREHVITYVLTFLSVVFLYKSFLVGLVLFCSVLIYDAIIIAGHAKEIYKNATSYLSKEDLIPGDLIENEFLDSTLKKKLGIDKTIGFTNVTNELIEKLDETDKVPVYSNSVPMTIPIFVGFISVFLYYIIVVL